MRGWSKHDGSDERVARMARCLVAGVAPDVVHAEFRPTHSEAERAMKRAARAIAKGIQNVR